MKEQHPIVRRITQVFEFGLQTSLILANSHRGFDPILSFSVNGYTGFGVSVLSNLDFELRYNHGITYKMETNYMQGYKISS